MAIKILTNSVLIDLKTVNQTALAQINLELAAFSGVRENNLRKLLKLQREESVSDGLKTRIGKTLKDGRDQRSRPSKTSQATLWSSRRGSRQIPTGAIQEKRRIS